MTDGGCRAPPILVLCWPVGGSRGFLRKRHLNDSGAQGAGPREGLQSPAFFSIVLVGQQVAAAAYCERCLESQWSYRGPREGLPWPE